MALCFIKTGIRSKTFVLFIVDDNEDITLAKFIVLTVEIIEIDMVNTKSSEEYLNFEQITYMKLVYFVRSILQVTFIESQFTWP